MRKSRLSLFQRWVALGVGVTFTLTNIFLPVPLLEAGEIAIPAHELVPTLQIPQESGIVEEIYSPPSSLLLRHSSPFVIHIQTAHGSYESAKKIEAILRHLTKEYGVNQILLEGAAGRLEPELDRYFRDQKLNRQVLEYRAERGQASGTSLFLLDAPAAIEARGIESIPAYRKNRFAFQEVFQISEASQRSLDKLSREIENLRISLPKPLRDFLARREAFEAKQISADDWFRYLRKNAQKKLGINLLEPASQKDWPNLVRLARLQKIENQLEEEKIRKEKRSFLKEIRRFLSAPLHKELNNLLEKQMLPYGHVRFLLERVVDSLPPSYSFDRFPQLKTFLELLVFRNELRGDSLFAEFDRLADLVQMSLAGDEKSKEIVRLLEDYRLLTRLFRLELTPRDYASLKEKTAEPITRFSGSGDTASVYWSRLSPNKILQQVSEPVNKTRRAWESNPNPPKGAQGLSLGHIPRVVPPSARVAHLTRKKGIKDYVNSQEEIDYKSKFELLFEKALEFYRGAKKREGLMARNILRSIRKSGKPVVVITGGFHTEGLKEFFRSHGLAYALVTPKLSETSSREAYLDLMLDHEIPFLSRSTVEHAGVYPVRLPILKELLGEKGYRAEIRRRRTAIRTVISHREPPPQFAFRSPKLQRAEVRSGERGIETNQSHTLIEETLAGLRHETSSIATKVLTDELIRLAGVSQENARQVWQGLVRKARRVTSGIDALNYFISNFKTVDFSYEEAIDALGDWVKKRRTDESTFAIVADILRTIVSISSKNKLFFEKRIEDYLFGETGQKQGDEISRINFYDDAKALLKKKLPTLLEILKDSGRTDRFLTFLSLLREMYEEEIVGRNWKTFFQIRELEIFPVTEGFRRFLIASSQDSGEPFFVELKIPGKLEDRDVVGDMNYKVAKHMWERFGEDSHVVKPYLYVHRHASKKPFGVYMYGRTLKYKKDPLALAVFSYQRGRRLLFETLNSWGRTSKEVYLTRRYLAKVARKNGMTLPELMDRIVRDTLVTVFRLHLLGYRGTSWVPDPVRDMHLGNIRLNEDATIEFVGDFGVFEKVSRGRKTLHRGQFEDTRRVMENLDDLLATAGVKDGIAEPIRRLRPQILKKMIGAEKNSPEITRIKKWLRQELDTPRAEVRKNFDAAKRPQIRILIIDPESEFIKEPFIKLGYSKNGIQLIPSLLEAKEIIKRGLHAEEELIHLVVVPPIHDLEKERGLFDFYRYLDNEIADEKKPVRLNLETQKKGSGLNFYLRNSWGPKVGGIRKKDEVSLQAFVLGAVEPFLADQFPSLRAEVRKVEVSAIQGIIANPSFWISANFPFQALGVSWARKLLIPRETSSDQVGWMRTSKTPSVPEGDRAAKSWSWVIMADRSLIAKARRSLSAVPWGNRIASWSRDFTKSSRRVETFSSRMNFTPVELYFLGLTESDVIEILRDLSGIMKSRTDVLTRQIGIMPEDIIVTGPILEQFQDQIDHDSGGLPINFETGFPPANSWDDRYIFFDQGVIHDKSKPNTGTSFGQGAPRAEVRAGELEDRSSKLEVKEKSKKEADKYAGTISKTKGVAEEYGLGEAGLFLDAGLSQRRALRAHRPNATRSRLDPGEHLGRDRTLPQKGVPPVSLHGSGFGVRTSNPDPSGTGFGLSHRGPVQRTARPFNRSRRHVERPDQIAIVAPSFPLPTSNFEPPTFSRRAEVRTVLTPEMLKAEMEKLGIRGIKPIAREKKIGILSVWDFEFSTDRRDQLKSLRQLFKIIREAPYGVNYEIETGEDKIRSPSLQYRLAIKFELKSLGALFASPPTPVQRDKVVQSDKAGRHRLKYPDQAAIRRKLRWRKKQGWENNPAELAYGSHPDVQLYLTARKLGVKLPMKRRQLSSAELELRRRNILKILNQAPDPVSGMEVARLLKEMPEYRKLPLGKLRKQVRYDWNHDSQLTDHPKWKRRISIEERIRAARLDPKKTKGLNLRQFAELVGMAGGPYWHSLERHGKKQRMIQKYRLKKGAHPPPSPRPPKRSQYFNEDFTQAFFEAPFTGLKEIEKEILKARPLAEAEESQSLEALGEEKGLTREMIRLLQRDGLKKADEYYQYRYQKSVDFKNLNFDQIPVQRLGYFSPRVRRAFRKRGIKTVGGLLKESPQAMLRLKNFAEASLREITEILNFYRLVSEHWSPRIRAEVRSIQTVTVEELTKATRQSSLRVRSSAIYRVLMAIQVMRFVLIRGEGNSDPEQTYDKYVRTLTLLIDQFGEDAFMVASQELFDEHRQRLDFYSTILEIESKDEQRPKMHSDIQPIGLRYIELAQGFIGSSYPIELNMQLDWANVGTHTLFGDPEFWSFLRENRPKIFQDLLNHIKDWPEEVKTGNVEVDLIISPRQVIKKYFPEAYREILLGDPTFSAGTGPAVLDVMTTERSTALKVHPRKINVFRKDREKRYESARDHFIKLVLGKLVLGKLTLEKTLKSALEKLLDAKISELDPLEKEVIIKRLERFRNKDFPAEIKTDVVNIINSLLDKMIIEIPYARAEVRTAAALPPREKVEGEREEEESRSSASFLYPLTSLPSSRRAEVRAGRPKQYDVRWKGSYKHYQDSYLIHAYRSKPGKDVELQISYLRDRKPVDLAGFHAVFPGTASADVKEIGKNVRAFIQSWKFDKLYGRYLPPMELLGVMYGALSIVAVDEEKARTQGFNLTYNRTPHVLSADKLSEAISRAEVRELRKLEEGEREGGRKNKEFIHAIGSPLQASRFELQAGAEGASRRAEVRATPSERNEAIERLILGLGSRDHSTRFAAIDALAQIGKITVPYLIEALEHQNSTVRRSASLTLKRIGAETQDAIPHLIKSFGDADVNVRTFAAIAVAEIGEAAVPALIEVLKTNQNKIIRKFAVIALGRMRARAKEAVPALIEALADKDIQKHASEALGRMGPEAQEAVPALAALLRLTSAATALQRIREASVPVLVEALKHEDDRVRIHAAESLWRIADKAKNAIPALLKALKDENRTVQYYADAALRNMGNEAMVPILIEEGIDDDIRLWAAYRLVSKLKGLKPSDMEYLNSLAVTQNSFFVIKPERGPIFYRLFEEKLRKIYPGSLIAVLQDSYGGTGPAKAFLLEADSIHSIQGMIRLLVLHEQKSLWIPRRIEEMLRRHLTGQTAQEKDSLIPLEEYEIEGEGKEFVAEFLERLGLLRTLTETEAPQLSEQLFSLEIDSTSQVRTLKIRLAARPAMTLLKFKPAEFTAEASVKSPAQAWFNPSIVFRKEEDNFILKIENKEYLLHEQNQRITVAPFRRAEVRESVRIETLYALISKTESYFYKPTLVSVDSAEGNQGRFRIAPSGDYLYEDVSLKIGQEKEIYLQRIAPHHFLPKTGDVLFAKIKLIRIRPTLVFEVVPLQRGVSIQQLSIRSEIRKETLMKLTLGVGFMLVAGFFLGQGLKSESPQTSGLKNPILFIDGDKPSEDPIVQIVEKTKPSVVVIHTPGKKGYTTNGSGIIFDKSGLILTAYHTVKEAKSLRVSLSDETNLPARLVYRDPDEDLAILQVETKKELQPLKLQKLKNVRVGETVIAIGHPFGYQYTVTKGIVSALGREISYGKLVLKGLIQTDAGIHPGSSGGPLLNLKGEVIGINIAVRDGAPGINFAVNANRVERFLEAYRSTRKNESDSHVPRSEVRNKSNEIQSLIDRLRQIEPQDARDNTPIQTAIRNLQRPLPSQTEMDGAKELLGRLAEDTSVPEDTSNIRAEVRAKPLPLHEVAPYLAKLADEVKRREKSPYLKEPLRTQVIQQLLAAKEDVEGGQLLEASRKLSLLSSHLYQEVSRSNVLRSQIHTARRSSDLHSMPYQTLNRWFKGKMAGEPFSQAHYQEFSRLLSAYYEVTVEDLFERLKRATEQEIAEEFGFFNWEMMVALQKAYVVDAFFKELLLLERISDGVILEMVEQAKKKFFFRTTATTWVTMIHRYATLARAEVREEEKQRDKEAEMQRGEEKAALARQSLGRAEVRGENLQKPIVPFAKKDENAFDSLGISGQKILDRFGDHFLIRRVDGDADNIEFVRGEQPRVDKILVKSDQNSALPLRLIRDLRIGRRGADANRVMALGSKRPKKSHGNVFVDQKFHGESLVFRKADIPDSSRIQPQSEGLPARARGSRWGSSRLRRFPRVSPRLLEAPGRRKPVSGSPGRPVSHAGSWGRRLSGYSFDKNINTPHPLGQDALRARPEQGQGPRRRAEVRTSFQWLRGLKNSVVLLFSNRDLRLAASSLTSWAGSLGLKFNLKWRNGGKTVSIQLESLNVEGLTATLTLFKEASVNYLKATVNNELIGEVSAKTRLVLADRAKPLFIRFLAELIHHGRKVENLQLSAAEMINLLSKLREKRPDAQFVVMSYYPLYYDRKTQQEWLLIDRGEWFPRKQFEANIGPGGVVERVTGTLGALFNSVGETSEGLQSGWQIDEKGKQVIEIKPLPRIQDFAVFIDVSEGFRWKAAIEWQPEMGRYRIERRPVKRPVFVLPRAEVRNKKQLKQTPKLSDAEQELLKKWRELAKPQRGNILLRKMLNEAGWNADQLADDSMMEVSTLEKWLKGSVKPAADDTDLSWAIGSLQKKFQKAGRSPEFQKEVKELLLSTFSAKKEKRGWITNAVKNNLQEMAELVQDKTISEASKQIAKAAKQKDQEITSDQIYLILRNNQKLTRKYRIQRPGLKITPTRAEVRAEDGRLVRVSERPDVYKDIPLKAWQVQRYREAERRLIRKDLQRIVSVLIISAFGLVLVGWQITAVGLIALNIVHESGHWIAGKLIQRFGKNQGVVPYKEVKVNFLAGRTNALPTHEFSDSLKQRRLLIWGGPLANLVAGIFVLPFLLFGQFPDGTQLGLLFLVANILGVGNLIPLISPNADGQRILLSRKAERIIEEAKKHYPVIQEIQGAHLDFRSPVSPFFMSGRKVYSLASVPENIKPPQQTQIGYYARRSRIPMPFLLNGILVLTEDQKETFSLKGLPYALYEILDFPPALLKEIPPRRAEVRELRKLEAGEVEGGRKTPSPFTLHPSAFGLFFSPRRGAE